MLRDWSVGDLSGVSDYRLSPPYGIQTELIARKSQKRFSPICVCSLYICVNGRRLRGFGIKPVWVSGFGPLGRHSRSSAHPRALTCSPIPWSCSPNPLGAFCQHGPIPTPLIRSSRSLNLFSNPLGFRPIPMAPYPPRSSAHRISLTFLQPLVVVRPIP